MNKNKEILNGIKSVLDLVDKQSEDEGLWHIATYAPEAYIQQELRKLHSVIEKELIFDE